MGEAVILEAVRTPIGKRGGQLAGWHPTDLLGHVLTSLIDRTEQQAPTSLTTTRYADYREVGGLVLGHPDGDAGPGQPLDDLPRAVPRAFSAGVREHQHRSLRIITHRVQLTVPPGHPKHTDSACLPCPSEQECRTASRRRRGSPENCVLTRRRPCTDWTGNSLSSPPAAR